MRKAQVFLREDQKIALQALSRRTGRKQSELIRHGVDLALAEAETTAPATQPPDQDWRAAWLAAAGMWADRTDIDETRALERANNQRRTDELERHWHRK